jgi:mgtE-like transporter
MLKGLFDKGFKDILLSQVVSIIGGLLAGVLLAIYTDKLLLIPGMLITLPPFLDLRGNISGALSSRISSGLFLGVIKPTTMKTKIIRGNIYACFLLVTIISLFLGLLAFTFNNLVLHVYTPEIILLFLVAALIANVIEVPMTIFLTFYFFRRGHDPNNILGPVLASIGDLTSLIALLVALVIV